MAEEKNKEEAVSETVTEQTEETVEKAETAEKETDGKAKKSKAEKKLENEIAALKAELAKKDAEAAEQKESYLRVVAEYDNFRKRSKAERDAIYSDACADVIGALLPVYDNIERAAAFTDGERRNKKHRRTAPDNAFCFFDCNRGDRLCQVPPQLFLFFQNLVETACKAAKNSV